MDSCPLPRVTITALLRLTSSLLFGGTTKGDRTEADLLVSQHDAWTQVNLHMLLLLLMALQYFQPLRDDIWCWDHEPTNIELWPHLHNDGSDRLPTIEIVRRLKALTEWDDLSQIRTKLKTKLFAGDGLFNFVIACILCLMFYSYTYQSATIQTGTWGDIFDGKDGIQQNNARMIKQVDERAPPLYAITAAKANADKAKGVKGVSPRNVMPRVIIVILDGTRYDAVDPTYVNSTKAQCQLKTAQDAACYNAPGAVCRGYDQEGKSTSGVPIAGLDASLMSQVRGGWTWSEGEIGRSDEFLNMKAVGSWGSDFNNGAKGGVTTYSLADGTPESSSNTGDFFSSVRRHVRIEPGCRPRTNQHRSQDMAKFFAQPWFMKDALFKRVEAQVSVSWGRSAQYVAQNAPLS